MRALALACGLAGAAGLSQFPEFAQQYLQRLAGTVDQLAVQVAELDAAAARFDMTRDAYLTDLATSRTGAAAADMAAGEIARHAQLEAHIGAFRDASSFGRLVQGYRVAERDLIARTLADFQPALPLTVEGAAFAGTGFLAGYGLLSLVVAALRWPFRARRRRTQPTHPAPPTDAKFEDDDDFPLVEYEGDMPGAMRKALPPLALVAHDGRLVNLAHIQAPAALFTYPIMGRPGEAFPAGWEEVDEADNATALACSFRDAQDMLEEAGIQEIYGISRQSPEDQAEAAHRLALPYTLLSDPGLELAFALDLPRFVLGHERYMAPAVIVVQGGRVLAALHPVRHAPTAAPRLIAKLEQARADHQLKVAHG